MIKRLISKSGETLIEVIISLTVIMFAGAAAASILITAFRSTALSEDYLIAQNLANESVELVKNLRDTNHMRYPLDLDTQWLVYNTDNKKTLVPGKYLLNYDQTAQRWEFVPGPATTLDLSDGTTDEQYRLYSNPNFNNLYSNTVSNPEDITKFYRQIEVTAADANFVTLNILVEWKNGEDIGRLSAPGITVTNY